MSETPGDGKWAIETLTCQTVLLGLKDGCRAQTRDGVAKEKKGASTIRSVGKITKQGNRKGAGAAPGHNSPTITIGTIGA